MSYARPNLFAITATRQRGAAMAISLIMLLLLTIIGLTATQTTTMQERMAGNARERDMAFQYAEAALRQGEIYLTEVSVGPFLSSTNSDGLYFEKPAGQTDWWDLNTTWASDGSGAETGSVGNAQFIVEELSSVATSGGSLEAGVPGISKFFRVTARGVGDAGTAVVLLQSTFKR